MPQQGSTALYRSAEITLSWGNVTSLGLLQNVAITVDAGVRPMFEIGSDTKFFTPDRAYASLKAARLYCKLHEDIAPTNSFGSLLIQDGFTMNIQVGGADIIDADPRPMKFFVESYRLVSNVGNVIVMEDISAIGEAPGLWTNFTTQF